VKTFPIYLLAEMLEIVITPKILEPDEIGSPRLKPFYPNCKSALAFDWGGFTMEIA